MSSLLARHRPTFQAELRKEFETFKARRIDLDVSIVDPTHKEHSIQDSRR
jgi:hypothetical protein